MYSYQWLLGAAGEVGYGVQRARTTEETEKRIEHKNQQQVIKCKEPEKRKLLENYKDQTTFV